MILLSNYNKKLHIQLFYREKSNSKGGSFWRMLCWILNHCNPSIKVDLKGGCYKRQEGLVSSGNQRWENNMYEHEINWIVCK